MVTLKSVNAEEFIEKGLTAINEFFVDNKINAKLELVDSYYLGKTYAVVGDNQDFKSVSSNLRKNDLSVKLSDIGVALMVMEYIDGAVEFKLFYPKVRIISEAGGRSYSLREINYSSKSYIIQYDEVLREVNYKDAYTIYIPEEYKIN